MSCNFHVFLGKQNILRLSVWSSSCVLCVIYLSVMVWLCHYVRGCPVRWCDYSQARRQTDFCKARLYRFTFVFYLDSRSCWQFLTVGIRIEWFFFVVCMFSNYLPSQCVPGFMPVLYTSIFKPTALVSKPRLCSKLMSRLFLVSNLAAVTK